MGAVVVVLVDELVDELLDLGEAAGLVWLAAEPLFEGLLESFDFAAGGGVVGAGVLLRDAEGAEFGFESVTAGVSGESGGVDHAVVGEGGGGDAVCGSGFTELFDDGVAGDAQVGGDAQGVAGVVVEEGDDLDVAAAA